jgi:hypothetical protein
MLPEWLVEQGPYPSRGIWIGEQLGDAGKSDAQAIGLR